MAVAARPTTLLTLYICCIFITFALASPIVHPTRQLLPRSKAIISNATGSPLVFSPSTGQLVPQGPATDGADPTFPFQLSWAAVINSVNSVGVSDLVLTVIVLAFSFIGFILGVVELGRLAGIVLLNVTSGLALGIRFMILRQGLLFSGFAVNWIIIGVLGLLAGVIPIKWQRAGIAFSAASTGTFLTFLGIDLIINKQAGMSQGLRFLFDRNSSHILDIIQTGYKPPHLPKSCSPYLYYLLHLPRPPLAYAQHKLFKEPFSRKPRETDSEAGVIAIEPPSTVEKKRSTFLVGLWDGATFKSKNLSRFSL
ncbi:hypothetical protein BD779DRAFT_1580155 [Infundibulicybe gibba]|nr:hypothetical protein BD779DRAFT_1580155 [Infundibulicybe gibba]